MRDRRDQAVRRRPGRSRPPRRDDITPRAPWTRRRGRLDGGVDRARPPPSLDHRRRAQPSADGVRRRASPPRVQRRDPQLPVASVAARLSVPHRWGHRGDPGRVPGLRVDRHGPSRGPVRLRSVRPHRRRPVAGARPHGRAAPLLLRRCRRLRVRIRGQGAAPRAAEGTRDRRAQSRRLPGPPVGACAPHPLPRGHEAPPGPRAPGRRPPGRASPAVLAAARSDGRTDRRCRGCRTGRTDPDVRRGVGARGRRPGRRLPEWRGRQQPDRRPHVLAPPRGRA